MSPGLTSRHHDCSPPLAGRRAAEHLDDPRPGGRRGVVGHGIDREEAVGDDLVVGKWGRRLAEAAYYEQRNVVAPGYPIVEKDPVQLRRLGQIDVALLPQLTREGLYDRLAGFDSAARQMPAADIAVLDQEDAT